MSTTTPEPYDINADLLEAAEEMAAIVRGERAPGAERVYDGAVLVEIRQNGVPTWRLADASVELRSPLDFHGLRESLRQSQEGMAALLGVPVSTVRNWDQGRRAPRGPAFQLLKVAAKHPAVLLDLA